MKRKALLDMQRHLGQTTAIDEDDIAFEVYPSGEPFSPFSRKRSWRPSMSTPSMATRDFFTPSQSPMSTPNSSSPSTPIMGVSHDFNGEVDNPLLFGPPSSSADWLSADGQSFLPMPQLKKARQSVGYSSVATVGPQVIEHPASNLVVVDKPYKCQIPGCDKAYKNQNGLKYHKMHGNCASNPIASGEGLPLSDMPMYENKPYKCNLCNKRYKNLNGLKYHTAHSHQNVTTESIQNQFAQSQCQKIW
jgi:transcription factor SFP1